MQKGIIIIALLQEVQFFYNGLVNIYSIKN